MDLRDYLRIFRKRWPIIVAFLLVGGAAAAAVAFRATPIYAAHTQLFVTTPSGGDNTASLQQGNTFTQERVKSYAAIVSSPIVLNPVIASLHLTETPAQLGANVSASAPLNTVLINVTVHNTSPAQAKSIADAVSLSFTKVVATLETPANGGTSPIKVSVVKQAEIPGVPVSPNKKLDIALGILIGLALGVGVAVLRETLDTTIKNTSDLSAVTKASFLGGIIFDPDVPKRPLITHADPQSRRAESFRHLRTNLQFVDVAHRSKSFVITSSVGGEGKSTTSANLALALAATGSRVALVEGDLRRPKVADYLGLERAVGLTTVLIGQATVTDVMQSWGNGQLHVLPAGRVPPNPSELLGSQAMQNVIRQLEAGLRLRADRRATPAAGHRRNGAEPHRGRRDRRRGRRSDPPRSAASVTGDAGSRRRAGSRPDPELPADEGSRRVHLLRLRLRRNQDQGRQVRQLDARRQLRRRPDDVHVHPAQPATSRQTLNTKRQYAPRDVSTTLTVFSRILTSPASDQVST